MLWGTYAYDVAVIQLMGNGFPSLGHMGLDSTPWTSGTGYVAG
jgi:hypothetical protein